MKKRLLFITLIFCFSLSQKSIAQSQCFGLHLADSVYNFQNGLYKFGLVSPADFNGDGKKDMVYWGEAPPNGTGSIFTYSLTTISNGNGDGTFSHDTLWYGGHIKKIVAGDFNGDGAQDLIELTAQNNYEVRLLLNDGAGNFTSSVISSGVWYDEAAVADFNGDQHLDIMLRKYMGFPGAIDFLSGNGNGAFGAPVLLPYTTTSVFYPGDFNQDGLTDMMAEPYLMLNNGSNSFTFFPQAVPGSFCGVFDFDSNGTLDLVGKDTVYLGSGFGNFTSHISYSVPSGVTDERKLDDMDDDGINDLILTYGQNDFIDSILILAGSGNGTFAATGASLVVPLKTWNILPVEGKLAYIDDLDGDGVKDLLVKCVYFASIEMIASVVYTIKNLSAHINSSGSFLCVGDSMLLNCSTPGQVLWSTGDTTSSIYISGPGTYAVTLTNDSGCVSTDSIVVNSISTTTFASLNAGNPLCFYQPPIQLTTGVPVGGTYSGPGVSNGYFNPQQAGTGLHTLTYTYAGPGGCTGTATTQVQVDMCVGMHEQEKNSFIKIYPNPGKRNFVLDIASTTFNVAVYDIFGKEIYQNKNQKTIQLPELSAGIYLFRVVADGKSFTERVIIE